MTYREYIIEDIKTWSFTEEVKKDILRINWETEEFLSSEFQTSQRVIEFYNNYVSLFTVMKYNPLDHTPKTNYKSIECGPKCKLYGKCKENKITKL